MNLNAVNFHVKQGCDHKNAKTIDSAQWNSWACYSVAGHSCSLWCAEIYMHLSGVLLNGRRMYNFPHTNTNTHIISTLSSPSRSLFFVLVTRHCNHKYTVSGSIEINYFPAAKASNWNSMVQLFKDWTTSRKYEKSHE